MRVWQITSREWEPTGGTIAAGRVLELATLTRMTAAARAELERFVLAAPARCREAFAFAIEDGRVVSFPAARSEAQGLFGMADEPSGRRGMERHAARGRRVAGTRGRAVDAWRGGQVGTRIDGSPVHEDLVV